MDRKIIDKVVSYIETNNMVADGDGIVVGLSGGADSVCLLFLLCELKKKYDIKLCAVHIHHGIRQEADEDANYAEELCKKLGIPFELVRENVPKLATEWKVSEEEAGRRVRYGAFERIAIKYGYNKIAVAHNRNDEAETVLFHLFRGSGLHGLTGIPVSRKQGKLTIIRPILCLLREEIEDFLRDKNIEWVTDRTNLEDRYSRNRIRHNILPEADVVSPGATNHICEAAAQLKETESLLESLEEECLKECMVDDGSACNAEKIGIDPQKYRFVVLKPKLLAKYHPVIKKRVILTCLKEVTEGGRDIGALQVDQLLELIDNPGNRTLNLARRVTVRRDYDTVVIYKPYDFPADNISLVMADTGTKMDDGESDKKLLGHVNVESVLLCDTGKSIGDLLETVKNDDKANKYTKWIDCDKIDGQLVVRTRKPGDYITVLGSDGLVHKKSLKDLMIDLKIPATIRNNIPLVVADSHCVWLIGYRLSDSCKLTESSERLIKLTYRE